MSSAEYLDIRVKIESMQQTISQTALGFCIDDLKIYTESKEECKQIYDRIIYCINNPVDAITFSKEYLRIGCDNTEEEDSDES